MMMMMMMMMLMNIEPNSAGLVPYIQVLFFILIIIIIIIRFVKRQNVKRLPWR